MEDKNDILASLQAKMHEESQAKADNLKVGDIIKVTLNRDDGLTLNNGYDTRSKYIVVIGFTPTGKAVGSLLVNSNIDRSKLSPEMLNCQYPLMARNYRSILDYDSWLDCSDIFELPNMQIEQRKGELKGCLTEEDQERVMEFLRTTDVFDKGTKNYYGII